MDQANRTAILQKIDEMLQDPTVNISWSRGMRQFANFATGYMEYEPTNGMTIIIKVHGGGDVVEREDPTAATSRLIREELDPYTRKKGEKKDGIPPGGF